jgi:hypothetical protein
VPRGVVLELHCADPTACERLLCAAQHVEIVALSIDLEEVHSFDP